MILALRVDVVSFLEGCGVRLISVGNIVYSRVASQAIVECSLAVSWLVNQVKTSSAIRDVSVSSSSIISVFYRFRMNISQRLSWSTFSDNE